MELPEKEEKEEEKRIEEEKGEETKEEEGKKGFQRLSKQQKRRLRYEANKDKKRQNKKKTVRKKRQDRAEFLSSMTDDERRAFIIKENEEKACQEAERIRAYDEGIPVLLDLSFYSLMDDIEKSSLVQQINESVGYLRKCSKIHLKLVCINACDEIRARLEAEGSKKWLVEVSSEDFEVFGNSENTLMLSPDASNVLEDIVKGKVYIIGGLVDRTKRKSISLDKAKSRNLEAVRLPIQEENIVVGAR